MYMYIDTSTLRLLPPPSAFDPKAEGGAEKKQKPSVGRVPPTWGTLGATKSLGAFATVPTRGAQ